jgi:REP element-mobilizing transposase RayT
MAVRNKIFLPNSYYFLTFTILGWKKIFTSDKYCQLVYKWFDYCRQEYNNKIGVYVIIPNHLHIIMKVSDKSPLPPKLIQNAKRFMAYGIVELLKQDNQTELLDYFTSGAEKRTGAKHKIFEPRYDSLILQSEKLFLEKLNYIHKNPCQEKWQLANSPEEYLYSSAQNYTSGHGKYAIDLVDF